MENIIQYLIYGLLFYYFFLGGRKKKKPEQKPMEIEYPRQRSSQIPETDNYYSEPETHQSSGSADILKEVEKILGIPPQSETRRAELPEQIYRRPEVVVPPRPKVTKKENVKVKREKTLETHTAYSHSEKGSSAFDAQMMAFDYDTHHKTTESAPMPGLVAELKKNIHNHRKLQELFIFSEVISRPRFRHRSR